MKIQKHFGRTFLAGAAAVMALNGQNTSAQSADALIDKLVDKGILTVREARDLREEADKDFARAYAVKTGMPDFVKSFNMNGDFRGRYEGFYRDSSSFTERHRWRYLARLGFTALLENNFEVGLKLGSGDIGANPLGFIDPISANQTLGDNGAKKGIFLDLAYTKWTPINDPAWSASFTIGKMKNPFELSSLVFDGDYTPEGAAEQFTFNLTDHHSLNLNAGQFVLDEIGGSSKDPWLLGAQLKLHSTWNEHLSSSLGVGGMIIFNDENLGNPTLAPSPAVTTGNAVPNINVGNTRYANGTLANNFNPVIVDGDVTCKLDSFPGYSTAFPITVAAEYMNNPAAGSNNDGYSAGITFGKAGKKGLWEIGYQWKELQADAWYEEFVDSDFGAFYTSTAGLNFGQGSGYRSGTNVRGHIVKAAYSPYDFLTCSLTWFFTEAVNENPAGSGSDIHRLQVDATVKF